MSTRIPASSKYNDRVAPISVFLINEVAGDWHVRETGYSSKSKPQQHYISYYSMWQINLIIILPCVKLPVTPDKLKPRQTAVHFSVPKAQEQIFPGSTGTFLSQLYAGKEVKTINWGRKAGRRGLCGRGGGLMSHTPQCVFKLSGLQTAETD